MEAQLSEPRYIYADILITLAEADGTVDEQEKVLLGKIFAAMDLDPSVVEQMWLTPRTLDIIENIVNGIDDPHFRNCLIKDCYLLALADEDLAAAENRFIKRVGAVMAASPATMNEIRDWVTVAIAQKEAADRLFGSPDYGL